MKKFLLSATVVVLFALYAVTTTFSDETALPNSKVVPSPAEDSQNVLPTSVPSSNPPPSPSENTSTTISTPTVTSTPSVKRGAYQDGEYTGSPADAFYGSVQVKAVISGGKITDVVFLSWPQDRAHSVAINNSAKSTLTSEAIQAQSANVDIVSGATDTSIAFQESLASALLQAKN